MFLNIAAIVIMLSGTAIGIYVSSYDATDRFIGAAVGFFIGFLAVCAAFVVIVLPCNHFGQQDRSQEFQLASAQDSTGVKGSFVWGTGTIGSSLTLNYYVQNDGYKSPRSNYGSTNTRIFEVKEGPFRVVEHYTTCDWLLCLNDTNNWSYDFYVPPGSVINGYTMDAK